MTPEEYEHHVAEVLRQDGWDARVTPHQHDHGVDIIAERGDERLAVQVKMFDGSNRRVAGKAVMELYGAAAFADCATAMIATDTRVLPSAEAVAEKLGIEIRIVDATTPVMTGEPVTASTTVGAHTFGSLWRDFVMPLAGSTLTRANGSTNEILRVDAGGIERRTSNGKSQYIEIEIFRWAIERLLRGETVTRDEVNAEYTGRASAGIMLILGQIPLFESVAVGRKRGLRMRPERDPLDAAQQLAGGDL